jgi:hypothetical protein
LLNYGPDESRVLPAPAEGPSRQVTTQNRAEYGHFNEARLLAITAHAKNESDSGDSFTNTHAQPIAPRAKQAEIPTESLKEVHAGQKRKGPCSTVTYVAASNKKKKKVAGEIQVAAGTVLRLGPNLRITMGPDGSSKPVEPKGYSCIRCIDMELKDCDGEAHCNNCTGFKCKYVLCKTPNCKDTNQTCIKIHPTQYDLNARKSGETCMYVVYDNQTEASLTISEKLHLKGAIARMDTLRTGRTTNTGENMLQIGPPVPVPGTKSWQAHKTKINKAKMTEVARPNALQSVALVPATGASTFGTSPWAPLTGAPAFGGSNWLGNRAQDKGKGVDRREPATGSGSGMLAPSVTDHSQAGPFAIPQTLRNAALKADMSAASDALSVRIGNAMRKDSLWSSNSNIKVEKHDE